MKCVVLGGGGFLGSHLTDALLRDGWTVRVFERPNLIQWRKFQSQEDVEWFEGDFENQEDVARAVAGSDVIVHLISTTLPKSSNDNPAYDVQTNIVGTVRLLERARLEEVRKVVFVSSGGTVYGVPSEIPIKESHPTDPVCSYGISKLAVEKYLHLYYVLHGLDYCVLRLANPFGPRQRTTTAQGAVAVFLDRALRKQEIEIWGDGSVVRDYLFVGDAVEALRRAVGYSGKRHRVFNIGAGRGYSLNELLDTIESLLGEPIRRRYLPPRKFDVPVNVLDISLAREVLGWAPSTPLKDGMRQFLEWCALQY